MSQGNFAMFRKLFGSPNNIESDLEARLISETADVLVTVGGITSAQASGRAKDILELAKRELKDAGEDDIYQTANGVKIVDLASRKSNLQSYIDSLREHGVT